MCNSDRNHRLARALVQLLILPLLVAGNPAPPDIIPIDEIRPGAKGTGLTVLSGDSLTRFGVEVIDVMRNVTPRGDLILCRLSGAGLEHTGVIQGMSGSPVYIDGRLAGAVAYTWEFSKDPIAGITPITEMTRIWQQEDITGGLRRRTSAVRPSPSSGNGSIPLRLPLAISRLSPRAAAIAAPALAELGLTPVAAAAGGPTVESASTPKMEPGAAIGVALADGDVSMAAVGTLTMREGDRVLAFGHPMLQAGPVLMPMIAGTIHCVIPSVASSFKLFSPGPIVGAVTEDRLNGIAGRLGVEAPMLPVRVRLESPTTSEDYRFRIVPHETFAPLLLAVGLTDIVFQSEGSLEELTLESDITIRLDSADCRIRHFLSGPDPVADMFRLVRSELSLLLDNRFREVRPAEIDVRLQFRPGRALVWLTSATPERQVIRPGDTLRIALRLTDYRGRDTLCTTALPIPATVPAGRLNILIGVADSLMGYEMNRAPGRFQPASLSELIDLLSRSGNEDRIRIVGLTGHPGFTMSGRELPSVPPAIRRVLAARTPDRRVEPTAASAVLEQTLTLGSVMSGVAQLEVEVRR
ncbi:MAG: SpoIVB peptidase S55 domain-containing protein [candidate division WOR-3 bacterium]